VPGSGRPVPEMTGEDELWHGEDSSQCSYSVLASFTLSTQKVAYRCAEQLRIKWVSSCGQPRC